MNSRLLADYLRRNRSAGTFPVFMPAVVWFGAALGSLTLQLAFAVSMDMALLFGLLVFTRLAPTEVQILPISRREISRTGWFLSVVVMVGVSTTAKLVGFVAANQMSSDRSVTLDLVWLSSLLDLACVGAGLCLLRAIQALSGPRVQSLPPHRRVLLLVAGVSLLLILLAGPFLVMRLLPIRWAELSGLPAALVLAGLGLTVFSFFHSRARAFASNKAAVRVAWQRSRPWLPELPQLSGVWRIAFETWKSAMTTQIALPMIILGATVVAGLFVDMGSEGWMSTAREFGLFPFDAAAPSYERSNIVVLYFMGTAGMSWPFAMLGYNDIFQFLLRHLRSLPLSTRQLDAIILAVPLIGWVNLWLLLVLLHVAVTGHPFESLRPTEWLALMGLDALVRALYLRLRSYLWPGILGVSALLLSLIVAKISFGTLPTVAAAFGIAALAAAWTLNYHTLTRTRLVYTRTTVLSRFAPALPQE